MFFGQNRRLQVREGAIATGEGARTEDPEEAARADAAHRCERSRAAAGAVITALACLLVLFGLLVPTQLGLLTPAAFLPAFSQ